MPSERKEIEAVKEYATFITGRKKFMVYLGKHEVTWYYFVTYGDPAEAEYMQHMPTG